jgi:hypothetical protein
LADTAFFSKSDRVMEWWLCLMPVEAAESDSIRSTMARAGDPDGDFRAAPQDSASAGDEVMLLRSRKSRFYFLRKFLECLLTLSA